MEDKRQASNVVHLIFIWFKFKLLDRFTKIVHISFKTYKCAVFIAILLSQWLHNEKKCL